MRIKHPHQTLSSTKRRLLSSSMRDAEFIEDGRERLEETEHGRRRDDFGNSQVGEEVNLYATEINHSTRRMSWMCSRRGGSLATQVCPSTSGSPSRNHRVFVSRVRARPRLMRQPLHLVKELVRRGSQGVRRNEGFCTVVR